MKVPLTFRQLSILWGSTMLLGFAVLALRFTLLASTSLAEPLQWVGFGMLVTCGVALIMADVIELKE